MAFFDALRIILSFFLFTKYLQNSVQGEPQVPCYFIFGDSFVDSGNNNNLDLDIRANYSPYGVDFPKGPTGRFTNGRTVADIIGQLLGFIDFIPPFANLTGKEILKGVNYASGGSGIRDETGKELGDVVSLNEQLGNHFTVLSKISAILNSESAARDYLKKCIYIVIIGTNDYLNNYFVPSSYQTSTMYTPQQYANVLVKQYSKQLKRLHSYGARKVAIFGVGLIGQLPTIMRIFGDNSSMIDAAAQLFSRKLLPLVTRLNKKLTNAKFTYINTTRIVTTSAPLLGSSSMAFHDALRIILSSFLFTQYLHNSVQGEPQVPCYFIFGDSLVDSGNNNNLNVEFKSNYPPYGVDFPKGPTGWFPNGRTIANIIGQLLGFVNFIPPFANLTGKDILKGVNYASGRSGIQDETGQQRGNVVTLNEQLGNHFTILSNISAILNSESAARQYLKKCMYIVITGINDYSNNYFIPSFYQTSTMYTPQQYSDVLVKQYSEQLKRLYSYGARKVAIFGVGLIGQVPEMKNRFGANSSMVDDAAQLFSNKLLPLVNDLSRQLTSAKFTYVNTTAIALTSSPLLAFQQPRDSCCELVKNLGTCIEGRPPCPFRGSYAYFDGFHPTEAVNKAFATRAYNRLLPSDASPYGIKQLAQLP
ncbi:GDSL esterase/lipase At5g45670-like [Punica granatum]|uniref:GDSL esterase/lipase At5g45670-like n=1 Tax=Punica granatum TaxID=22663 RepID=A0A6P8C6U2_PUNGR|nr:GDSL esterase/lipase At5g45670-like [Punica granatum]